MPVKTPVSEESAEETIPMENTTPVEEPVAMDETVAMPEQIPVEDKVQEIPPIPAPQIIGEITSLPNINSMQKAEIFTEEKRNLSMNSYMISAVLWSVIWVVHRKRCSSLSLR